MTGIYIEACYFRAKGLKIKNVNNYSSLEYKQHYTGVYKSGIVATRIYIAENHFGGMSSFSLIAGYVDIVYT